MKYFITFFIFTITLFSVILISPNFSYSGSFEDEYNKCSLDREFIERMNKNNEIVSKYFKTVKIIKFILYFPVILFLLFFLYLFRDYFKKEYYRNKKISLIIILSLLFFSIMVGTTIGTAHHMNNDCQHEYLGYYDSPQFASGLPGCQYSFIEDSTSLGLRTSVFLFFLLSVVFMIISKRKNKKSITNFLKKLLILIAFIFLLLILSTFILNYLTWNQESF